MGITRKVQQFGALLSNDGFGHAARKTAEHISFRIRGPQLDPVAQHRAKLHAALYEQLEGRVGFGPFKGMTMAPSTSWQGSYRASMLLGLYEQEVLEALERASSRSSQLIDIGAADGFYSIGVLTAGWFDRTLSYEMSLEGQQLLLQNARANGVEDRVTVRGAADIGFHNEFTPGERKGSVILIDVEGAEFDLIDDRALEDLKNCTIIIEIHDWIENGIIEAASLQRRSEETHDVTVLRTGERDPGIIDILKDFCDTDRWLLCSEDRPKLMKWLLLEPKT